MFLVDKVHETPEALGRYRELLLGAFDARDFGRLYEELFGKPLGHDIDDMSGGLADVIQRTLTACAQRGRPLAQLLARAVRVRAARAELVKPLVKALGLIPVVQVAKLLADHGCPDRLREDAARAVEDAAGTERAIYHRTGREAWIDVLVWLQELPAGAGAQPPLLAFLEKIAAAWRPPDAAGPAGLRQWLATHAAPSLPDTPDLDTGERSSVDGASEVPARSADVLPRRNGKSRRWWARIALGVVGAALVATGLVRLWPSTPTAPPGPQDAPAPDAPPSPVDAPAPDAPVRKGNVRWGGEHPMNCVDWDEAASIQARRTCSRAGRAGAQWAARPQARLDRVQSRGVSPRHA